MGCSTFDKMLIPVQVQIDLGYVLVTVSGQRQI